MQQQRCSLCKVWKDADILNFYVSYTSKSGFTSWCRECTNTAVRERRRHKILPDFDPEMLQCCLRCKKVKKITEYHRSKDRISGFSTTCKACMAKQHKEYRSDPDVIARIHKKSKKDSLLYKYGLTVGDYEDLCAEYPFCPICLRSFEGIKRNVDHDHVTGKVRGMLCDPCNLFIGAVKEDTEIILKMIEYLKTTKEKDKISYTLGE